METFILERVNELKEEKDFLERKLGIKIKVTGKKVEIQGEALNEYEASLVIEAINFGFPARTAVMVSEEDMVFKKVNIKEFTRRKDMESVRGRVIGSEGRTKRTIENISGCEIFIKNNEVGIIGHVEDVEYSITALQNLIRGSKQSNVYNFLEKTRKLKKEK